MRMKLIASLVKLVDCLETSKMAKKNKQFVSKLVTFINTVFYDYQYSHHILIENTRVNDSDKEKIIGYACQSIKNQQLSYLTLKNNDKYFHIALDEYHDLQRNVEDELIYKIDEVNGCFYISTGIYCGVINLGNNLPQIEIETGYSERFTLRMLNFSCGIYADKEIDNDTKRNESIYALLIQYLFLTSLRKVANKAIPKKYTRITERGYNIHGNIDINSFINEDLFAADKKMTYTYPKRLEIQPIIDVLYLAFKKCKIQRKDSIIPNMANFENYINQLYSGVRPSMKVVAKILQERSLSNSLYSDYKKPLKYAQILLSHDDLNNGKEQSNSGLSGYLVDSSFLWEMYLLNLMRIHLKDWKIDAQVELSFYEDTFFSKKNYPDLVLTNIKTGAIFIFDAKFKRMDFEGRDVDNEDIRQVHAYSYYFHLKEGDNFKGAALIYPTKKERDINKKKTDNIFGLKQTDKKFGIFSIKDPSNDETMRKNENNFINEIRSFLEG